MNKKGFTLVELLAVILLVTVIAGLAVPNVMSSINNSKRNTFLLDAKRMIAKAEYFVSSNRNDRTQIQSGGKVYTFSDLNEKAEFLKDADGGSYEAETFVYVFYSNSKFQYCACILGSKKRITGSSNTCSYGNTTPGSGCVLSDNINGVDVVKD